MSESDNSKNRESTDSAIRDPLDLPDGTGFVAVTPRVDIQEMIAMSERYLPILNSRPDFVEKKKRSSIDVPFEL